MSNFFNLETQFTEDMTITRQQRIYSDFLKVDTTLDTPEINSIITQTHASKLKIKFNIEAVERTNPYDDNDQQVYKVGQYYELEDEETLIFNNSTGAINLTFHITEPINGASSFYFDSDFDEFDSRFIFYLTGVVFEDSFYNNYFSWFNVENPENLVRDNNNIREGSIMEMTIERRTNLLNEGAPVYAKTFIGVNNNNVVIDLDKVSLLYPIDDEINDVVGIEGTIQIDSGGSGRIIYIPCCYTEASAVAEDYYYATYYDKSNKEIILETNHTNWNNGKFIVTLYYTKI